VGPGKFCLNMSVTEKRCSKLVFRDVNGCGDKVEGVIPAFMSATFIHSYLGFSLIFGENKNNLKIYVLIVHIKLSQNIITYVNK
jgi:hypothetical protein